MPQISTIAQAAAATNRSPTPAQIAAGNYAKGRCEIHGLRVAIENPKGSIRSGVSKAGKTWSIKMRHHYGEFTQYTGRDGDPLDVFIGPDSSAMHVYVVNQVNPDTGRFDEHKCLAHFADEAAAREGYLASYTPGWKGLGGIKTFTIAEFKRWILSGDLTKRAADFFIA